MDVFFSTGLTNYLNMAHGIDLPPNHYWSCRLAVTSFFTFTLCSTLFILSMTFDRFYSIIRPHKAASFNTVKRAKITILFIVAFSFLYNIPHLFLTQNRDNQCVPYGKAKGTLGQFYYWLSFGIHFAFPFTSLLTMNSVIIHAIQKSFKIRESQSGVEQGQGKIRGQGKSSETQVFATLLLVTFAFLILTTPAYVFFLYVQFFDYTKSVQRLAGFHLFYHVAQKLQYTNYGINFFLYVISGEKFRVDLINLFKCKKRKLAKHLRSTDISTQFSTLS